MGPVRFVRSPTMPMEHPAAPEFEAPATGGKAFKLSQHRGRALVLYFYLLQSL